MKKTVIGMLVAGTLGLAGTLAMAQDQAPVNPPQGDSAQTQPSRRVIDPNVQAKHMAKKLGLTADQQTQIAGVLTAQRDQVTGLRGDSSLSRQDRHAKMQAIRADSESKIRSLLTDEQKQSFDQMQQRRLARQQNHRG